MASCGEAAHLVPDTILLDKDIIDHHPATHQGYITGMEQGNSVRWLRKQGNASGERKNHMDCYKFCRPP